MFKFNLEFIVNKLKFEISELKIVSIFANSKYVVDGLLVCACVCVRACVCVCVCVSACVSVYVSTPEAIIN